MKPFLFPLIVILCGCSNPTNNQPSEVKTTVVAKTPIFDKQKLYANTDTVIIASEHFDTLEYSKVQFNEIVDHFPIFYDSLPDQPDIAYQKSGIFKEYVNEEGVKKKISFGSEAGQDEFYILYAHFLQKNYGEQDLPQRRERLIAIYQTINELFGHLTYGGTYFAHQYNRINGYAEYGVYQYRSDSSYYLKPYSIQRQKGLYLAFLRQRISDDEVSVDSELSKGHAKNESLMELLKYVKTLDSLITDNFYLKKAVEFQSAYY
jgi:hypothetical protein